MRRGMEGWRMGRIGSSWKTSARTNHDGPRTKSERSRVWSDEPKDRSIAADRSKEELAWIRGREGGREVEERMKEGDRKSVV